MSKYKFIKIKSGEHDTSDVLVRTEAIYADDLAREFRHFLLACGFAPHSIAMTFRELAEEYEADIDLDLVDDEGPQYED